MPTPMNMSVENDLHGGCHAVCWKSILAGAVTAAVVSLVLFALGTGIGFASFSPYGGDTESIASFTIKMAIWMIIMQWLSAGLGGYIAGRLRKRHSGVQTDEVYFRDTAHGFLTWSVATIIVVTLLASAATSIAGGGAKATAAVAAGAAAGAGKEAVDQAKGDKSGMLGYYTDALFRGSVSDAATNTADSRNEAGRILVAGMTGDQFPAADRTYLAQMIASRTGVSEAEATVRVDDAIAKMNVAKEEAKQAADKTRKASSAFAIFTALSMMIGAFIASVAGVIGGRHRDVY